MKVMFAVTLELSDEITEVDSDSGVSGVMHGTLLITHPANTISSCVARSREYCYSEHVLLFLTNNVTLSHHRSLKKLTQKEKEV